MLYQIFWSNHNFFILIFPIYFKMGRRSLCDYLLNGLKKGLEEYAQYSLKITENYKSYTSILQKNLQSKRRVIR